MTQPEGSARYQIILSRQPFGDPGRTQAAQEPAPTPPAESFAKHLRMCAITESAHGIRVGIVDIRSDPPKSYYLGIGDREDDIEVVDAHFEREAVLLRRGSEEVWLQMDGGAVVGMGAGPSAGPPFAPPAAPPPSASPQRMSYAERLRQRREAMRQREREMPRLTGEELKEHLKQYQMELIRARGELGPPLPIPLTKEMDDQLVQEGVLPPTEE